MCFGFWLQILIANDEVLLYISGVAAWEYRWLLLTLVVKLNRTEH
ncbi:hypothetical protein VCR29J2_390001 [Vibrio coralliirubri]|nr:hypothetical protein VCR29J2_390001 [Vibrio coralliirubri]